MPAPKAQTRPDVRVMADALERIIHSQIELHRQVLSCMERKRRFIRTAAIESLTSTCAEEHSIVRRLADLERQRETVVARLSAAIDPQAALKQPLTLGEIAQRAALDETGRARLLALGGQLRDALCHVKSESSIVRNAAEALSKHMTGIAQSVNAVLSRARIYGHRGCIALGAPVQSVLDVKS